MDVTDGSFQARRINNEKRSPSGALFLRMNGRKMERGGGQCEAAKHEVGHGAGEPGGARPEAGKKTLAFAAIRAYFGANGLIYL